MSEPLGIAAANGQASHERHVHTLDDAAKIVARIFSAERFCEEARQLIGEGAELEYKVIVKPSVPSGYAISLCRYARSPAKQILFFGGLK